MEPERRGRVIGPSPSVNPQGEERTVTAKPFVIPKPLVWNAWRLVRANRGAAGVDELSLKMFERDLRNNLYRLWNRMSSGSYFPPPVKEVLIPKKSGGERPLGIPTVSDRVAQAVVKLVLEPSGCCSGRVSGVWELRYYQLAACYLSHLICRSDLLVKVVPRNVILGNDHMFETWERLRFGVPPLLPVQLRQIGEARCDVGMLRPPARTGSRCDLPG
jgi:hypothetical protein